MKIECSRAEVHNPIFVGGRNLQTKLNSVLATGIYLLFDTEAKELLVSYNKETVAVMAANIAYYVPKDQSVFGDIKTAPTKAENKAIVKQAQVNQEAEIEKTKKRIGNSAQVGGPTHHVFAEQPGRTND